MKKVILPLCAAALPLLLVPSRADAYGAASVGYTHVGPNGVYHTTDTAVRTPAGAYGYDRTAVYGRDTVVAPGYGAPAGGYHYTAAYSGNAGAAYSRTATSAYSGNARAAYGGYGYVR